MAFPLKVGINYVLSKDYVEPLLILDFELLSSHEDNEMVGRESTRKLVLLF
jgi:hypothetical protein